LKDQAEQVIPRLALALSLVLLLLAALPAANAQSTLTIAAPGATGAEPDPQRNSNVFGYTVSELVADTLVLYVNGEYTPALAESWELQGDGVTYTFNLREGVTFTNGTPLTAEAVVASFERIVNPDDPLPSAGQLSGVTRSEAVDELTFELELAGPDPDFLLKLTEVWIIDPATAGDEIPVGTGPYAIVDYEPDQQTVLERYEEYWAGTPEIERIVARNIPEPATLVLELEAGTIDAISFAPINEVARLEGAGFQVLPFSGINTAFIAVNNETLPVELRQAICYAVDRNVLINAAYAGLGSPQLTIAKFDGWAHDPGVPGYEFDPERAIEVLEAAGIVDSNGDGVRELDGQPLNLDFQARGDGEWLLATQIIQQFLGDVGIGTTITASERNTYYTNVRTGEYDLGWWIDNAQPEPPIWEYAFHSQEHWNVTQGASPEIDALIEAGRGSTDQAERAQAYFELERIVFENAMVCPMFWVEQAHVVTPGLSGMDVSTMGVMLNAHNWRLE